MPKLAKKYPSVKAANDRYTKKTYVPMTLPLNKNTDADILEFLETVENKRGTIKTAIREYMENHAKKAEDD